MTPSDTLPPERQPLLNTTATMDTESQTLVSNGSTTTASTSSSPSSPSDSTYSRLLKNPFSTFLSPFSTQIIDNDSSQARDHLASERTFLAWIRTSLTLASIGIALAHLVGTGSGNSSSDRGGVVGPDSISQTRQQQREWMIQEMTMKNVMVEMEERLVRIRQLEEWQEKRVRDLRDDDSERDVRDDLPRSVSREAAGDGWLYDEGSTVQRPLVAAIPRYDEDSTSTLLSPSSSSSSSSLLSNHPSKTPHQSPHPGRSSGPGNLTALAKPLGCAFVILGLLTLVLGTRRYFTVQGRLTKGKMAASRGETATMSLLVGALMIAVLASIIATVSVD